MDETTRGTFKIPGVATAATFIAQDAQLQYDSDLRLAVDVVTGSRDPQGVYDTLHDIRLSLLFPGLHDPEGITFFKRGINLADGIQTSFSAVLRMALGSTLNYVELANCIIGAGTLSMMGSGPLSGNVWIAGKLVYFGSAAPTNWTFVSPVVGAIMMSAGAGANHVTITDVTNSSTTSNPSIRGFTIGFNNQLFPIPQTGQNTFADIIPTTRSIITRYVCNMKDLVMEGIHQNAHEINDTIVLNGSHSFTGTGGKLGTFKMPIRADQPLVEGYEHVMVSGVLA